jgi:hypothetical protein
MNSIAVSSIVFASIFGSGLVGMAVRRAIPADYLGPGEKEVARLVTGLMTTMAAIVLGMLVSSAKASYDARTNEVAEISSEVVTIDRMLSKYGAETAEVRAQFRLLVEASLNRIWPPQAPVQAELKPRDEGEILVDELQVLAPKSDSQAQVKAQVLGMVVELRKRNGTCFSNPSRALYLFHSCWSSYHGSRSFISALAYSRRLAHYTRDPHLWRAGGLGCRPHHPRALYAV